MSVDPDLRIALGVLLVLRFGLGIMLRATGDPSSNSQQNGERVPIIFEGHKSWRQRLVWTLFIIPLIAFLLDVHFFSSVLRQIDWRVGHASVLDLPTSMRWLLVAVSVCGLLAFIAVRASLIKHQSGQQEAPNQLDASPGIYRQVRYPEWLADLILLSSMLIATGNWISIAFLIVSVFMLRYSVLPELDRIRLEKIGTEYSEYMGRTGYLLPQFAGQTRQPAYSVPQRFGLNALIALVTLFAVIFGLLNAFAEQVSEVNLGPLLHLYFGLLLTFVWVAQMRFEKKARLASVVVGAVLLPVFVLANTRTAGSNPIPAIVVLGTWGGILGYCMGTVAAGFFLVLDWIGPHLPWSNKSTTRPNSSPPQT